MWKKIHIFRLVLSEYMQQNSGQTGGSSVLKSHNTAAGSNAIRQQTIICIKKMLNVVNLINSQEIHSVRQKYICGFHWDTLYSSSYGVNFKMKITENKTTDG